MRKDLLMSDRVEETLESAYLLVSYYRLGEWCNRFSSQFKRLTDREKAKHLMDVVGERSLLFFPSANEESPLLQSYRFVYEMRDLRECSLKKNIVDVERDAVSFSEGLSRVISIPVQKKHYGNIVFRESLARLNSILCDGASKTFVEVKKLARKGLSTLHHEQCPKKQVIAECPCLFASRILSSKLFFFL